MGSGRTCDFVPLMGLSSKVVSPTSLGVFKESKLNSLLRNMGETGRSSLSDLWGLEDRRITSHLWTRSPGVHLVSLPV